MSPSPLPVYRIGAVARRVGVSVHTLRVWESRHGVVQPTRTSGGDRMYSEEDVTRLKLVSQSVKAGHAVGTIAALSTSELRRLSLEATNSPSSPPLDFQASFLVAAEELDVARMESVQAQVAASMSPRQVALEFIAPVLVEIGARWEAGRLQIRHEHVATASLRRLLASVTPPVPASSQGRTALVATPAGNRHEFGGLVVAMLARLYGWRVVQLGVDVPAHEIVAALKTSRAKLLLLSVAQSGCDLIAQQVAELEQSAPASCEILVGGGGEELSLKRGQWVGVDALERRLRA